MSFAPRAIGWTGYADALMFHAFTSLAFVVVVVEKFALVFALAFIVRVLPMSVAVVIVVAGITI